MRPNGVLVIIPDNSVEHKTLCLAGMVSSHLEALYSGMPPSASQYQHHNSADSYHASFAMITVLVLVRSSARSAAQYV